MAVNLETLALAKKFTEETVVGGGAVKGKNCVISNITTITGGQRVTFQWTLDNGDVQTRSIDVMDGISITDATIDASNHLILTLSDGNTIDSGELPVVDGAEDVAYTNAEMSGINNVKDALDYFKNNQIESAEDVPYSNASFPNLDTVKKALDEALDSQAVLDSALTVSNPVGSATSGKTYAKGTSLETVLRDILIKEIAPSLTLTISPSTTLYDVVTDTVSAITMNATCTKNTYNLSKVEFYLDNVLKHTQSISASDTYSYNMEWATPTNSDFTLKAVVYDSRTGTPMSTTKSKTVKFVGKSYYGTIADSAGEPTEAIVKALQNNVLKDTKNLTYSGITMDYGRVVYAYPASFGNLSSIKDIPNNIQYWPDSFTKITLTIDSISYNVYFQSESSASEGISLTFS